MFRRMWFVEWSGLSMSAGSVFSALTVAVSRVAVGAVRQHTKKKEFFSHPNIYFFSFWHNF
jgi:hypothetical protein